MTRTQLLPEILKLTPSDQLLIVEAIHRHLGTYGTVNEAEFRAELDRRVAEANQNPADESPLEDVLERVRRRR
jgi:putative addiction module component (TIGR02574 family)